MTSKKACRMCEGPMPGFSVDVYRSRPPCSEMVKEIFGFELKFHEELPRLACQKCANFLKDILKYRRNVQAIEEKLWSTVVPIKQESKPPKEELPPEDLSEPIFEIPEEIVEEEIIDEEIIEETPVLIEDAKDNKKEPSKRLPIKRKKEELNEEDEDEEEEDVEMDDDSDVFMPMDDFEESSESEEEKYTPEPPKTRSNRTPKKAPMEKEKLPETETVIETPPKRKMGRPRGRGRTVKLTPLLACEQCGKQIQRRLMGRHLETAHRVFQKKRPCDLCDEEFDLIQDMYKHRRVVHKEVRKRICDICGKSYTAQAGLTEHMKSVHTERKTEECPFCKRHYFNLKGHIKKCHNPDRKLTPCPKCGKEYKFLPNHVTRCQTEGKHVCDTCGKTYHNPQDLIDHRNKHFGIMVKCLFCSHEAAERRTLNNHMNAVHPEEYAEHKEKRFSAKHRGISSSKESTETAEN